MSVLIYGILITLSMILGILINTPFAKYALLAAGSGFEIAVILFCTLAILEGYFLAHKPRIQSKLDADHDSNAT